MWQEIFCDQVHRHSQSRLRTGFGDALKTAFAFLLGAILSAVILLGYLETTGRLRPREGASGPVIYSPAPDQPATNSPAVSQPMPSDKPLSDQPIEVPTSVETREIEPPLASAPAALATPEPPVQPAEIGDMAIPVVGVQRTQLRDHFNDSRGGGRSHRAIDIAAARGAPVIAAVSGKVLKLFLSRAGGITLYQIDDENKLIHYYSHLDGYAPAIAEGRHLSKGEVLGYVGTTGNAPPNAPHLHYAINLVVEPKQWWKGEPINPFPLLMAHGITYTAPAR